MPTTTKDPIRSLVHRAAVTVSSTRTLRVAAETMTDELVGALVVENVHGAVGIITERDLVRAIADDVDPSQERVGDYMTDSLLIVSPQTPIGDVAERMLDNEVRHVLVEEEDGPPGVVSLRDVAAALLADSAPAIA